MNGDAVIVGRGQSHKLADSFATQFTKALLHILSALAHCQVSVERRVLPENIGPSVRAFEKIAVEVVEDILAKNAVTRPTGNLQLRIESAMKIELVAAAVGVEMPGELIQAAVISGVMRA